MDNYFKSNLKFVREKRGLSKNKLGELTGVNQTTISRWENGNISPSIDNVIDLMNALNLPINELGNFLGKNLSNSDSTSQPSEEDLKKVLKEKNLMDNEGNLDMKKIDKVNKIYEAIIEKED